MSKTIEKPATEAVDLDRLVSRLRAKKAHKWGKVWSSRAKTETEEERAEFWKTHAEFVGYLQALDDIQANSSNTSKNGASCSADVFCERAYRQETGRDAYYRRESSTNPGRYNSIIEDDYVEWLEKQAFNYLQNAEVEHE